jgi:hypothetical protein
MTRSRWAGPVLVGLFVAFAVLVTGIPEAGRDALVDLFEGEPPTARIVNGDLTSLHASTGALLLGSNPQAAISWCTGVLIGQRTFLTAAHCVCEGTGADCQGARRPSPSGRVVFFQHAGFFTVASIHVHPDFRFPVSDLAVIRLAQPVTGITPTPLITAAPAAGEAGMIVGFGRSGGETPDFGLKRAGGVVSAPCRSGISDVTSLCWSFDGGGSNSCNGDSGGPLFMDVGEGMVVAGTTSGGMRDDCLAGDLAYDTNVFHYRDWIRAQGGDDVGAPSYGAIPPVGDPRTTVLAASGTLNASRQIAIHTLQVPKGTNELRIAFNAYDDGTANFDFLVRAGRVPTNTDFHCRSTGSGQYGSCEFVFPDSGIWYVLVRREIGSGDYQLTTTLIGGDPPVCGNALIESGEECDGAGDDACPGFCEATCTCPPACLEDTLVKLRGRIGSRFLVKAVLEYRGRDYSDLNPSTSDFVLTFHDGPDPVEVVIPAGDSRWTNPGGSDTMFLWQGSVGSRKVVVRCRKARSGSWHITLKGRDTDQAG